MLRVSRRERTLHCFKVAFSTSLILPVVVVAKKSAERGTRHPNFPELMDTDLDATSWQEQPFTDNEGLPPKRKQEVASKQTEP